MKSIHLIMVSRTNQTRLSGDGCVVVLSEIPLRQDFTKAKNDPILLGSLHLLRAAAKSSQI